LTFSSVDPPAPSPPASSPATEMRGARHLGGRTCIAVGLDLSACRSRRRLVHRRLGLGVPLHFSGGGGGDGVVSGEDRRRIVLLQAGAGVDVFGGASSGGHSVRYATLRRQITGGSFACWEMAVGASVCSCLMEATTDLPPLPMLAAAAADVVVCLLLLLGGSSSFYAKGGRWLVPAVGFDSGLPDATTTELVPVVGLLVDGGGRISSSFSVDGAVDVRSTISVRRAFAVTALATCPIAWGPMTERKMDAAAALWRFCVEHRPWRRRRKHRRMCA